MTLSKQMSLRVAVSTFASFHFTSITGEFVDLQPMRSSVFRKLCLSLQALKPQSKTSGLSVIE